MPLAFVTVKTPDGSLVHLDVDLRTQVDEFRSILAPKTGVQRHRQRLVFAGRLLQDGRTLEAYGVERNSTIHLLTGGQGGQGGDGGSFEEGLKLPSQLSSLQRHVLQNPDILQQMLESPAMQSLLNDFDFMRGLLKTDPRLTKLLESNPELMEMLQDQEFMSDAAEKLRNPVHVRDVLRSTERATTALESLSGGSMDVLRHMCEDIQRPVKGQEDAGRSASKSTSRAPSKALAASEAETAELEEESGTAKGVKTLPEWAGTFDTNAMASMMQDQNMQQLLSQLTQTMPGPTKKLHPDDPFLDPSFIGQMFHAPTVHSVAMLQQAVEQLSMTADFAAEEKPVAKTKSEKPAGKPNARGTTADAAVDQQLLPDSSQVLSGLNPKSPAANFKESFNIFLQAEQESPEIRFKSQLQAMANMGFTDKEACIQALHANDGNMNRAVESLMPAAGR
jgi:ubiquilin